MTGGGNGQAMLEALIFDVDGTLAETEEAHRSAFNLAFAEAGLDWVWDQELYLKLLQVTGGKERIRHYLHAGRPKASVAYVTEVMIGALHRRKTALYGEIVRRGQIELRPGIGALAMAARRAGVRLAIATTTHRSNVDALLGLTLGAAASAFEVIVAGDEVAEKKPAPDVYVEALRRLGLRPESCLAIEDSANGLQAARGAGIPVVVTRGLYLPEDPFDGAAAVLDGLCDLLGGVEPPTPEAAGDRLLTALRALHASPRAAPAALPPAASKP